MLNPIKKARARKHECIEENAHRLQRAFDVAREQAQEERKNNFHLIPLFFYPVFPHYSEATFFFWFPQHLFSPSFSIVYSFHDCTATPTSFFAYKPKKKNK